MRRSRLRFKVRGLMIAATAVAYGLLLLAGRPEFYDGLDRARVWKACYVGAAACAKSHRGQVRYWGWVARLSSEGRTNLESHPMASRPTLTIDEVGPPRHRPADEAAAAQFDREQAEVLSICRRMAAYHERLALDCDRVAWMPWRARSLSFSREPLPPCDPDVYRCFNESY